MDNTAVSEAWIDGFAKVAVEHGLSKEMTEELFKLASHRMNGTDEEFLQGYRDTVKEAFAPQGNTLFGTIRDTLLGNPYTRRPGNESSAFFNNQLQNIGGNAALNDEDRYAMLADLMRTRKHRLQRQLGHMSV